MTTPFIFVVIQVERKIVMTIMNKEIGEDFRITQNGMLVMEGRICKPNIDDLRKVIPLVKVLWKSNRVEEMT